MNTLHPTLARALAPFAPPPLRWYRVKHTDARGRQHSFVGQYIDGFQAIEKNAAAGLCGLAAHPMTPEEVAQHLNTVKSESWHEANDRRAMELQGSWPATEFDRFHDGRGY